MAGMAAAEVAEVGMLFLAVTEVACREDEQTGPEDKTHYSPVYPCGDVTHRFETAETLGPFVCVCLRRLHWGVLSVCGLNIGSFLFVVTRVCARAQVSTGTYVQVYRYVQIYELSHAFII